ncbi:dephospho-CoA kinase [soil metagenome]
MGNASSSRIASRSRTSWPALTMLASPPVSRAFVIGVTGNIACGKTTVMNELRRLGASSIDADRVYHQLIEPESVLWKTLVDHFGEAIVDDNGQIDRRALGGIVFGDSGKLAELERLTHPAIRAELRRLMSRHGSGVVAVDAVKLIEGGMQQDCSSVWLVTCRADQQVSRLIARNGLSVEDAEQRVAAQSPTGPKLDIADVHIDNSGEIEHTLHQVRLAWEVLGLDQIERHAGGSDPVSH